MAAVSTAHSTESRGPGRTMHFQGCRSSPGPSFCEQHSPSLSTGLSLQIPAVARAKEGVGASGRLSSLYSCAIAELSPHSSLLVVFKENWDGRITKQVSYSSK